MTISSHKFPKSIELNYKKIDNKPTQNQLKKVIKLTTNNQKKRQRIDMKTKEIKMENPLINLENDIYDLISKDTFELVAYHLSLNLKDTIEYKFNKKII